jgi:CRP-like cAMP-binding protein
MQGGGRPDVRVIAAGEYLYRQAEPGTTIALILDGTCEVRVDGTVVGQVGPGTVVGERAWIEGSGRTADIRALTDARVAETDPGTVSAEQLSELALGHHREDTGTGGTDGRGC